MSRPRRPYQPAPLTVAQLWARFEVVDRLALFAYPGPAFASRQRAANAAWRSYQRADHAERRRVALASDPAQLARRQPQPL